MPDPNYGQSIAPGTQGGTSPFGVGSQAIDLTRLIEASQQTTQAVNSLNKILNDLLATLLVVISETGIVFETVSSTISDSTGAAIVAHGLTGTYYVQIQAMSYTGSPPTGAFVVNGIVKADNQIVYGITAVPGGGSSVTFDVTVFKGLV